MSVRAKLIALILFVALVPLSISAFTSFSLHQSAFDEKVEELQQTSSDQGAVVVHLMLNGAIERIKGIATPIPWTELTAAEREGAMLLVFEQHADIAIVQLNGVKGDGVGEAMFRRDSSSFPDHILGSRKLVNDFAAVLQVASDDLVIGEVFVSQAAEQPLVSFAIPLEDSSLAVALSLRSICRELDILTPASLEVALVAPDGTLACSRSEKALPIAELHENAGHVFEHDLDGARIRLAVTETPFGFAVITHQPSSAATAVARRMRYQTLFWIALSLIVALAGGWFLAVEIRQPIETLVAGANELAKGDYGYRLETLSGDEFGRLADAFNTMGSEIETRDAEIRSWNEELQGRVEQRTRDLKDAQQQLLESQKLAAVSSLAAGLAHEVNNPLTAVLGISQLLLRRAQKADDTKTTKALTSIEREAKRIGEIVSTLRNLAREADESDFASLDLQELVGASVEKVKEASEKAGVSIKCELDEDAPPIKGSALKLQQVVIELVSNALIASNEGDEITVRVSHGDRGLVKLEVIDEGVGISEEILDRVCEPFFTTKGKWDGRGLGLSVVHQIVTEHLGTMRIESELGEGTHVHVLIPIARAESQLP